MANITTQHGVSFNAYTDFSWSIYVPGYGTEYGKGRDKAATQMAKFGANATQDGEDEIAYDLAKLFYAIEKGHLTDFDTIPNLKGTEDAATIILATILLLAASA